MDQFTAVVRSWAFDQTPGRKNIRNIIMMLRNYVNQLCDGVNQVRATANEANTRAMTPGPQGPQGIPGTNGSSGVVNVTAPITNSGTSTAANIGISAATTSNAGSMSAADKTKLDGLITNLGQITVSQIAVIAIALGWRDVTVALTGAVVGGKYLFCFKDYRLNGGAFLTTKPTSAGYVIDGMAVCTTANQITVTLQAPLLAVGASYDIRGEVIKLGV